MSRKKAMGTLSGIVEPIGALCDDRRVPLSGTGSADSPGACSRGDDLRGCGGTDSRVGAGQSFRYGNDRICGWICVDDDSGCGAGIKESRQCWHGIRLSEKANICSEKCVAKFLNLCNNICSCSVGPRAFTALTARKHGTSRQKSHCRRQSLMVFCV